MGENIIDSIRRPEYTGENRCEPCTLLNVVIAALLGSVIARKSKIGGVVAVGISIGLIYLRGYLVPGTPALTRRYLPPEVLRWFGKNPEADTASGLGAVDPQTHDRATHADDEGDGPTLPAEPDEYFLEFGLLEPCEENADLCLTESFETAWFDEIDRTDLDDIDADRAATAFGFEEDLDAYEVETYGEARVLRHDTERVGKWPSRAALVADVTAARVLESWDPNWTEYDPTEKGRLLDGLRLFLDTCPTSGGDVHFGEETVESCCRSHEVVAATCEETGERLFEYPVDELEA